MPVPSPKSRILFFDVNETLLDMTPVKTNVGGILPGPGAADLWFATTLQHSLVMSAGGQYAAFSDIGVATLRMLARGKGVDLDEEDARAALAPLRSLPPHPDVEPALARLGARGWRMAALSNSSLSGLASQMAHAGLDRFFERRLSVESVGRFKPHAEVYRWAAGEMGVEAAGCMLVAAHGWDVSGAKWAGWRTAFVARAGQAMFPLGPAPDLEVADLTALADALAA